MVIAKVSKSRGWKRSGHLFDETLEEVEDDGGRPRDCIGDMRGERSRMV